MTASPLPAATTSLAVPLGRRVARRRGLLIVTALVLATAVLLGWYQSRHSRGFLDPDGVDLGGSRALVRLLQAQGVRVVPARTAAEVTAAVRSAGRPADATVLVTLPAGVRGDLRLDIALSGADLVLVTPGPDVGWLPGVTAAGAGEPEVLAPRCDLPVAVRAGSARVGGQAFGGAGTGCYPSAAGTTLRVVTAPEGQQVVALGSPDILTNEHLDEDGNAALAMGLLGADPVLVWYRPLPEPGGTATVGTLIPEWVGNGTALLLVAGLLAALWRGRRLGPLVPEALPVTVRAAETVEGRGRLYRRAGDRAHSAAALRAATRDRLAARLGLPPRTSPELLLAEVVAAAAERTGRDRRDVRGLLDPGQVPPDDAALVRLAHDLDRLEQEVRHR